jgi:hypothetical protein
VIRPGLAPAITQSIPSTFKPSSGPSSGSQDRNRTAAGTARKWSARTSVSACSIDTPIHRLGGQSSVAAIFGKRADRLVRTW